MLARMAQRIRARVDRRYDVRRFAAVKAAELSLLSSSVRNDADAVRAMLASDFVEIGSSGRRWTLNEIVAALSSETPREAPKTSEWDFHALSADVVLVVYRTTSPEGDSYRSSIWMLTGRGPVLRFHQGTPVPTSYHHKPPVAPSTGS